MLLPVHTPDPPSTFTVSGWYQPLPSTGDTTCVPTVQPALVKVMNDPPTVVKSTSSVDAQLKADMVGNDHAAHPPPPEPPPKNIMLLTGGRILYTIFLLQRSTNATNICSQVDPWLTLPQWTANHPPLLHLNFHLTWWQNNIMRDSLWAFLTS